MSRDASSLHRFLQEAAGALERSGVERPRWTAGQLVSSVLGIEPIALVTDPPPITDETRAEIQRRVSLRSQGVPLQYLTGIAGFFGRDFRVGPGVFIPRPETERVVEVALQELARLGVAHPTVADVGTGSGAIAISLTLEHPAATIIGFEISPRALAVAQENAQRLGAASRVRWVRADLMAPCGDADIDLVVANLPYLPTSALSLLPREVRWDPPWALDGGPEGLSVIRRLLAQAAARLPSHGCVVLEVGEGQARPLCREAQADWPKSAIFCDDLGIERVVVLRHG